MDANRIRAGHSLPIQIEECDLRTVVERVCEEFEFVYGNRFKLKHAGYLRGHWSCESIHNMGKPLSIRDRQLIFDPFKRAENADRSRAIGWGLGLTLVKGLTEVHGGRVEVRSSEAVGTTFTVTLPRDARLQQSMAG